MNPIPTITSFSPTTIQADSDELPLSVTGTNFVEASIVYWAEIPVSTTFVSATELTATVPQSSIPIGGPYTIAVYTPPSEEGGNDGGKSNVVSFSAIPSLVQAKSTITDAISAYRVSLIGNYCTFAGAQWDTGPTSISNINGIITIGLLNGGQLPPGQQWRDYNNNMVDVSFEYMAGLAVNVAKFAQATYAASWQHKANVAALTDTTAVLAYDYESTLWPDPNMEVE